MANKTIYGCVNRTTGAITFAGEACDSGNYTGCIVRSGDHAGQVAVTINEANCDDTYYGCINRSTGEFQLVIPDDCCEICGGCHYGIDVTSNGIGCATPWIYCFGSAGVSPNYLNITFSGVKKCSDGESSGLNGSWCLQQNEYTPTTYLASGQSFDGYSDIIISLDLRFCSGGTNRQQILVYRSVGSSVTWFNDNYSFADTSCFETGPFTNEITTGDCGEFFVGYEGQATLVNPCA